MESEDEHGSDDAYDAYGEHKNDATPRVEKFLLPAASVEAP